MQNQIESPSLFFSKNISYKKNEADLMILDLVDLQYTKWKDAFKILMLITVVT
jgi:hypothetical protein